MKIEIINKLLISKKNIKRNYSDYDIKTGGYIYFNAMIQISYKMKTFYEVLIDITVSLDAPNWKRFKGRPSSSGQKYFYLLYKRSVKN